MQGRSYHTSRSKAVQPKVRAFRVSRKPDASVLDFKQFPSPIQQTWEELSSSGAEGSLDGGDENSAIEHQPRNQSATITAQKSTVRTRLPVKLAMLRADSLDVADGDHLHLEAAQSKSRQTDKQRVARKLGAANLAQLEGTAQRCTLSLSPAMQVRVLSIMHAEHLLQVRYEIAVTSSK